MSLGIRNDFFEKWSIKLKSKENMCEGWVKCEDLEIRNNVIWKGLKVPQDKP